MRSIKCSCDAFPFTMQGCRILLLVFLLSFATVGSARVDEDPKSFALAETALEGIQLKIVPKLDVQRYLEEDRIGKGTGPGRFAIGFDTKFNLDNSGTWQGIEDGRLWRLRIRSDEARNMNLGITRFNIAVGAKLWVYNPGRKHIAGPYTSRDRNKLGSLWTPIVGGDEIVVELFVPRGDLRSELEIGKVNRGYRGFTAYNLPGIPPIPAASCQIDVCKTNGDPWRPIEIDSVIALTIDGTQSCTGTFLNNQNTPFRNLILTAFHCLGYDETKVGTVNIYYNYQFPCDVNGNPQTTPEPVPTAQSSGISIASSGTHPNGLLLLEVAATPVGVHYAGWSSSSALPSPRVGIHHPLGDVKKISIASVPAVDQVALGRWQIDWQVGGMESGSSGSCLFDSYKRCVGGLQESLPQTLNCSVSNQLSAYHKLSTNWAELQPDLYPGMTGPTFLNGDPHIITVNGVPYDFQAAGEFVALRDPKGLEIQTRQTAIATSSRPGPDPHTGLASCVSVNTAFAARVGNKRVTYQPDLSGSPDSSGLQLRIDGRLTTPSPRGLDLGNGGNISSVGDTGAIKIVFPDESIAFVTPGWWETQREWYLNVSINQTPSLDGLTSGAPISTVSPRGIAGAITPGGWLPDLPDGTPMGSIPGSLHDRYVVLYEKFANAWRVTEQTSLFDYAQGTSTDNFTVRTWPPESSPCEIAGQVRANSANITIARDACEGVKGDIAQRNCLFDVMATGHLGFAKTYREGQRILIGATKTTLDEIKKLTKSQDRIELTATVAKAVSNEKGIPTGSVQFLLDGRPHEKPIKLDSRGQATCRISGLRLGEHVISARYTPNKESDFISSESAEEVHTVK